MTKITLKLLRKHVKKFGGRAPSGKSKESKVRKLIKFLRHRLKTKSSKKKLVKLRKKIKSKKKKSGKKR